MLFMLAAVHKRRLQSGEGVCPVRTKRSLQMRTSALFGEKCFLKIMVCFDGQEGDL